MVNAVMRYVRTKTRHAHVQCAVLTLTLCSALLYWTVTTLTPTTTTSTSLPSHRQQDTQRWSRMATLWASPQLAENFKGDTFLFPGSPAGGQTGAVNGQPWWIEAEAGGGSLLFALGKTWWPGSAGDLNQRDSGGGSVRGGDTVAEMDSVQTAGHRFVFPELNAFSLSSLDLSRVGQLNLLYFDTTPRTDPRQGEGHELGQEFGRGEQGQGQDGAEGPETGTEQPVARPVKRNGSESKGSVPDLHMTFQPLISGDERLLLLFVFHTFIRACEQHGLTYFLYGGALLGAYRHHDVIPWDDDIDVMMPARQRDDVTKALNAVPEFGVWTPPGRQWKFYWQLSPALSHKEYRWPYVDIFFFQTNGTHLYDDTREYRADYRFPLENVFPLQLRPFAGAALPVPCNMQAVLRVNYFPWLCETSSFLHKLESPAPRHLKGRAACRRLFPLYPFVWRQQVAGRGMVERVVKGGAVLTTSLLPPFCGEGGNIDGERES